MLEKIALGVIIEVGKVYGKNRFKKTQTHNKQP